MSDKWYISIAAECETEEVFSEAMKLFREEIPGLKVSHAKNNITILPPHIQLDLEQNPSRRAALNMLKRMKSKTADN